MKLICKDLLSKFKGTAPTARGISSVSADVEKMLGPKSYEELQGLEMKIRKKLDSDEQIDVDYWEHLLKSLQAFKAKARLRKVSQAVVQSRLDALRKQQEDEANIVNSRLVPLINALGVPGTTVKRKVSTPLDPEMFLKLSTDDKNLDSMNESQFLQVVTQERQRILKLGYVPNDQGVRERPAARLPGPKSVVSTTSELARFMIAVEEDASETANAQFQREVARGIQENEEVFTNEETVSTISSNSSSAQYQARKPKFYNRVQLGYEWNKYNQTHYDHDNPPPKVVQGYRFNIFYPNLIDKSKAPTYKIEREGGRKRGQTFAPAGEEDTCVIRFIAGAPYEDIAFRIVDKEWDYSAKRERGFKSTFENVSRSPNFG